VIDRDVYSYIIFGDKITLIDSGVTGSGKIIFDYITKDGKDPKKISMVILSHSHPDHIGSVKAIKEATKCSIAAHSGEKDWIEDTEKQFIYQSVIAVLGKCGHSTEFIYMFNCRSNKNHDKPLKPIAAHWAAPA
jgi:glyoxylase-like metal-dependent hydrolase (beta-lactamase superfamily II)